MDYLEIKKIKEGDIGTFEKIFRQYYAPLCLYAFSITDRHDIAEEVVQDVFYNIWKDRTVQKPISRHKSY